MDRIQKRKVAEALRGLIGSGFTGNQEEMVDILASQGFEVTQSTISRTLRRMGVAKVHRPSGVTYEILGRSTALHLGRALMDLILEIENNENLLVIKTRTGSAMYVAGFIDEYCKDLVLGTVAGDDTIFVAPRSIQTIETLGQVIFAQLKEVRG